jgi:hypothetical protein
MIYFLFIKHLEAIKKEKSVTLDIIELLFYNFTNGDTKWQDQLNIT